MPVTPPRVSIAVGPWTGSVPSQLVTEFTGGSVKCALNGGPEVRFTMPGKSAAALITSGLATDVWVYRKGVLWQRCRVLPVDQSWNADGEDVATVVAVGYRKVIEARHIITGPPTFTGVDQAAIMWALINATQATTNGDLGVTDGSVATGVTRDRNEYKIGDNLGKLMGDLGNVIDGAWWGVDAALVFTAQLWTAFASRPDPIVLGANARSMQRTAGKTFANVAGAIGSTEHTVVTWANSAGLGADPRGRWEVFDASHSSVTEQATVDDYADGLVAEREHPPAAWRVELDPASYFDGSSDYAEGEFVRIVVPTSAVDEVGVPPVDVTAQITEVVVGFDEHGATSVALAAVEVATP